MPIATNSKLGWILSGNTNGSDTEGSIVCLQTEGHLDDLLRSFWEVEEPLHAPLLSAEDKMCEEHYVSTTVRLSDGRYQVRLPQKPNAPTDWANSRQIAKSCLLSLERRFSRNPSLRSDYVAAMNQMVHSNQMRKVSIEPQDYGSHYFLPHHAVVKESSTTTRVRPVFNASARNAAGHSLNENLLTGPNLLPQLVLVLAHWRCYPIAFVADVSKMYLQVRLHPEASKLAYAAVLYVRIVHGGGARVTLLASKTKVAPLKSLSIPRLELCAALLLVKLTTSFLATADFNQAPVHLWSDSKTALHWIHGLPSRWPVFVANRCSEIVTLLPQASWHYVNTKHNPANVASRGCPVSVLREDRLWWNGPETLSSTTVPWPNNCDDFSQIVPKETEEAESNVLVQSSDAPPECDLILRYSSYRRLSKILAHCLRFVTKLAQRCERPLTVQFQAAANVEVSVEELEQAERHLCRMTQNALLSVEIKCISAKSALPKSHPLVKLCPIIRNGLLCVGGRLRNAQINEDRMHPIILPATSHLVGLLIDDMHEKMFHGGAQLVTAHLRQRYWIPRLKIVLRARLLRCVICLRYGAETAFQRMADLPGVRVTPCRPFKNAGLDYAGPFLLKAYTNLTFIRQSFRLCACVAPSPRLGCRQGRVVVGLWGRGSSSTAQSPHDDLRRGHRCAATTLPLQLSYAVLR
ncbi:unnamed protein product, partial [Trichogramma brassicae]